MSDKKWLKMFAGAVVLSLLLCALFNILTDPFGVFGDPIFSWDAYNQTNNPRTAKIAYLEEHKGEYDSFIIGSSSAASMDPELLSRSMGGSFYNLFSYGCDSKVYLDTADYLFENHEVKNLVLVIGLNDANTYDEERKSVTQMMHPLVSGQNKALFYLKYAFSSPQYGLEKIRSWKNDTLLPQAFDVFIPETGCYDKSVRDVERISSYEDYMALYSSSYSLADYTGGLNCIDECTAAVEKINAMCEENGAEFTLVFAPVYEAQWAKCESGELACYKEKLAGICPYWDFSCSDISLDARFFYDATHFRNIVGEMMVSRMAGKDCVYENFGVYVENEADCLLSMPEKRDESAELELPILMYHHLSEEASEGDTISIADFEAHLDALLSEGYTTVLPEEVIAYVNEGAALPEKPIMLCFDDGYESNFTLAFDALSERSMRAAVFIIGSSFGKDTYKDTGEPIISHFGSKEAQIMLESGVFSIQSHTWDMHQAAQYEQGEARLYVEPLPSESDSEFVTAVNEDIAKMRALLSETGSPLCAQAYPGGVHSLLSEVALRGAGVEMTLTSTPGKNILVKGLDECLRAMKRYSVKGDVSAQELIGMVK